MRISDWSSDVCSSDLLRDRLAECLAGQDDHTERIAELIAVSLGLIGDTAAVPILSRALETTSDPVRAEAATRSEERRVGQSVSVRVEFGGRRLLKKKIRQTNIKSAT